MLQRVLTILWPAFLAAAMGEGFFFAVFDPRDSLAISNLALSPEAVYTLGFFFFWTICTLAGMLTYYLVKTPNDHNPPF